MQTAIVIVSYNGSRWLGQCLKSCQMYAPDVPVYVVDNASIDGSAELAAGFSEVTVLKQVMNRGFAGGNNAGISAAIKDGAEAVMLLNQDAELTPSCLTELVNYLASNHRVGGVQPAILLPDGRVNSLGNSFHFLGFGEAAGNGLTQAEAAETLAWLKNSTEPPYLSGAAVLLRAAALKQIGLFNEDLFMYHEDLELSLRLRSAGWQLAIEPRGQVVHYYEQSRSKQQYYYMERNRLIVWNEIFQVRTLLLFLPVFLLTEFALLVSSLWGGWFVSKIKTYLYFANPYKWYGICQQRRRFMKLKRVSDAEILSYAAGSINYQDGGAGWLTRLVFNPISSLVWLILKPLIRW